MSGYPWLSMVINGYERLLEIMSGYPWLPVLSIVMSGYWGLSMVING